MIPYVKSCNARQFFGTLLAIAFLTCGLWGVQPAAQAPPPQTGGVTFRVDVELTTVEVMVRDKKGNPVKNLTKDDFQLFEDGKRQDIVTFVEISDDQDKEIPTSLADIDDSTAIRGKIVLIFFDDSHLTSTQVQVARQSAEKYMKAHMRPFDLFAVATYGPRCWKPSGSRRYPMPSLPRARRQTPACLRPRGEALHVGVRASWKAPIRGSRFTPCSGL
jgi:hypothetical protein